MPGPTYGKGMGKLVDVPECVVCDSNAQVSEQRGDGGRLVWKCGDCGYSWDR